MRKKTTGFTLIEMLVGIVIGMIVVAAASVMMVTVLKSQKDVTASARLNQELGAVMAVMSNEIRRAGFRVCDVDDAAFVCPDNDGDGNEDPIIPAYYALGEDIKIVGGTCIEYRYNADLNHDPNTLGEHRGLRRNSDRNTIQMGSINKNVTCADAPDSVDWIDLTNPKVIKITALNFSTTGSKCRNMSGNFYWVVGDGATGLACDDGTNLDSAADCIDLNDPADPRVPLVAAAGCGTATTVMSEWITGEFVDPPDEDALFGVNQIRINLQATLTRDLAVSKILRTSVKIANPWIR